MHTHPHNHTHAHTHTHTHTHKHTHTHIHTHTHTRTHTHTIRESKPDSGHGVLIIVLKTPKVFPLDPQAVLETPAMFISC